MKKLFSFLLVALLAVGFVACQDETSTEAPATTASTDTQAPSTEANELPTFAGVEDVTAIYEGTFDPSAGVTATDPEDGDITTDIVVSGTVDLNTLGDYTVTYTVEDSEGGTATVERTVSVMLEDYASGFYNYKFASTELRHTFMAAAEDYLLHNLYAGIPLFDNGGYVMYSQRVTLPVSTYVPVMGYGSGFGTMSADDSTVEMDDEQNGEAGHYTYRTTISENPGTWNQWLYDTSTDSDLMGYYYGSPYAFHFNDDKTGYSVDPSMASTKPTPVGGRTTDSGLAVSNEWSFTLRDDLQWFFSPDTDATFTAGLVAADYVIDGNDFVDTFKLALEEGWFRAVSGGGDFINSAQEVVGAGDFADDATDWENVGIKLADDNLTITFTFVDEQSQWNVMYWLSSFVMTPINLELYNYLENDGDDNTTYGTSYDKIGYHGPFYTSYFESDVEFIFDENPNYHDTDEYFYDSYLLYVKDDPDLIFTMFEEGLLDGSSIPTAKYPDYKGLPGVLAVPGSTIYRMMINGLETTSQQTEAFPDSTWVPEPILANNDFKQAMFFSVNREYLATVVMQTRQPSMYLFSSAYVVDGSNPVKYRESTQGLTVGTDLASDTNGYNFDAAQAYFEKALDALVEAGVYQDGTAANPTVITLEFNVFSGSASQEAMAEYIEEAFEDAFVSTEHNIKVDLEWYPKDFPGIYYDYMMTGDFDLSIGGISGSTLDAASFLDTYSSDNRSGFTLNWGIDTSVAEIPMFYTADDGTATSEYWSYDAIVSALNGEVYVLEGREAEVPAPQITDITSTTVTFDITEFDNAAYDNITYTVLIYTDAYVELAGYVDIEATSSTVTVTGLTPYFNWYASPDDASKTYVSGDYVIQIDYDYKEYPGKTGSSQASWFNMATAVEESVTNGKLATISEDSTPTDVELAITIDAGMTATLTSVVLTDYADFATVDGATLDYSDLSAVTVDGLAPGERYVLWFTFSDGSVDVVVFNSETALEAEVTATETGATMDVTINEDDSVTRTISSASVITMDAEGVETAVAGAAVDYADLEAVAVTGLAADTDYYVVFTLSDSTEVYVAVTTPAAATE